MASVFLTKRVEFAASHRYVKPEWNEAQNRAVFGACYNPPAHGHNYLLEVTVRGEIDPVTGMVVNLFDLKRVLLDVLEEFDHKNLNLDMPYFKDRIPTSENFARLLWMKLAAQRDIGTLHGVRLYEDEDLYADVTEVGGLEQAWVTRRYTFTALRENGEGYAWDLHVTVHGPIDPVTGMVTNISDLDRLVHEQIVQPFERRDLREVLEVSSVGGSLLVKTIWDRLVGRLASGTLATVRLDQTRDLSFTYTG